MGTTEERLPRKGEIEIEKEFRLHLSNGKSTDWFLHSDLTTMVRKNEGRIIAIEELRSDIEEKKDCTLA